MGFADSNPDDCGTEELLLSGRKSEVRGVELAIIDPNDSILWVVAANSLSEFIEVF
ncbi:hypothetical protein GXM_04175 [Nostoc sphaeroides CCNUC1]|uniref:Uncharacterized protein n=1 Tax=Nostoc sphaeroides CCNUC1 TaxID=2653204 RepID=A0A5P8W265_9NOSO|nr:hypothetical protein GXM_04175 [Nostoc sphaeroides CCNUC1]